MKTIRQPSRRFATTSIVLGWIVLLGSFAIFPIFNPIEIHWDGGYQLTIHVTVTAGRVKSVRCTPFFDLPMARQVARGEAAGEMFDSVSNPFTGQPLQVRIDTSGISGWYRNTRHEEKYVAIVAEFDDGRIVGKVVESPAGIGPRSVNVVFP